MKKEIKNKLLNEAITKKGQIKLGAAFMGKGYIQRLSSYNTYDNDKTIFYKFYHKFQKLQEEYKNAITKLGMNYDLFFPYGSSGTNKEKLELGEAIGKVYPELLDMAKADAWNSLNDIMAEILAGNYEY